MPTNCSNWLTSTCLTFVSYRSVRKRSAQQRCGSDYYPQTNDGKLVLVASSIQRSNKNLRYIVNRNFIICYSMMFCLGTIFAWDVCGQFKYWLESLINCTPRYIQPHMRAINQLAPQTQHLIHHPCWFLAPIKLQSNEMQVGMGWESFAAAHGLKEHDTIIVSVANDLSLVAMVFNQDGCERTFYWYIDI
ncbi:hypothetical protein RHMOL_Rhmol11G0097700 [Rhododendron molle]|uniref:Uncharacterized protein n=1 Tax=Rhododendron molle TaxID=49168 RepID=A0ACC0LQL7_RHOML|nr:hypothetical protein RHMOL_Rhmol11G0097700 [Rhododendron molle]